MNRFENLNIYVKFLIRVCFLVVTAILLELFAFSLTFILYFFGINNGSIFNRYKDNFHPIITGKPLNTTDLLKTNMELSGWNEYDPWYGYRNSYRNKEGLYATDALGFINHGDPERNILFKSRDTFRIFILGGSTVAGHGSSSPDKTISAQLEKYLNLNKQNNISRIFQVINSGVAGYHSSQELAYLEFEIIYYKPDMIIVFNGINDLTRMTENENVDTKLERYHWSSYHKFLKSYIESASFIVKVPDAWQAWKYSYFFDLLTVIASKINNKTNKEIKNLSKII